MQMKLPRLLAGHCIAAFKLYEGSSWVLVARKVVHLAMDETVMGTHPAERMRAMRLMFNMRGLINDDHYQSASLQKVSQPIR
jgi:hypothetical protein